MMLTTKGGSQHKGWFREPGEWTIQVRGLCSAAQGLSTWLSLSDIIVIVFVLI